MAQKPATLSDTIELELVSPERLLLSGPATQVVVPGAMGDMGVLPGHAPVLSTLRPGMIEVQQPGGKTEKFLIRGGFVEISPERCTVLAESALNIAHTDRTLLQKERDELNQKLTSLRTKHPERTLEIASTETHISDLDVFLTLIS